LGQNELGHKLIDRLLNLSARDTFLSGTLLTQMPLPLFIVDNFRQMNGGGMFFAFLTQHSIKPFGGPVCASRRDQAANRAQTAV
jgi:hypothetical protein